MQTSPRNGKAGNKGDQSENQGYEEFQTDALWFCQEMDDYLRKMSIFAGGAMKKTYQPMGEKVLRRRVDAEQK
jgi:hypothetical protein